MAPVGMASRARGCRAAAESRHAAEDLRLWTITPAISSTDLFEERTAGTGCAANSAAPAAQSALGLGRTGIADRPGSWSTATPAANTSILSAASAH